jgi:glutamate--cysteine ligase
VEYIEVRCMDLDPFVPAGIAAPTIRFLDVFLLHCLLQNSPPDTPAEIVELGHNQHRTAAFGRQPGLELERGGKAVKLVDWAAELLAECAPIAAALDAAQATTAHTEALDAAHAALANPDTLPSARALETMQRDFAGSHIDFIRAQADQTRSHLLGLAWTDEQQQGFEAAARESIARRVALELADTGDFETFRQAYLAPERLQVQ